MTNRPIQSDQRRIADPLRQLRAEFMLYLVYFHEKLQPCPAVCEIGVGLIFYILADPEAAMARKLPSPNFEQTLELLRAHSFDVAPVKGVAGAMLVSKHGAGAILVPTQSREAPIAFVEHPGVLVNGEVGRLLDRGYQKFIKTSKFELPASAAQLQAIHTFSEELKQLTGEISLYNESLGTTSDIYEYDRLKGREAPPSAPVSPWSAPENH